MTRQATAADAAAIAAILHGWVQDTAWMPKLHSAEATLGFARHLIADQVTQVLALPQVAGFLARDDHDITALYLAPKARRQGHGTALLAKAQAACPMLTLYTFQANLAAQRFYARAGFIETARSDGSSNEERLPDIRLIWHKEPI